MKSIRRQKLVESKNNQQIEAIICGFTKPRKGRQHFGALILGKYKGDKLIYIGHTGSGFTEKTLKEIYQKIQPLITGVCPFEKKPKTNMPVTWIKPKLICEVKFLNGHLRTLTFSYFLGLRQDKTASDEKG